jgi:Cu-Zn family superoxide dismutase
VSAIDLGGAGVPAGDGIALRGRTLYVAQNAFGQIAKIQLSGDLSSGRLRSTTRDPSFAFPTTIAIANGRLLVVNSQFDKRGPGLEPALPFTASSVRIP